LAGPEPQRFGVLMFVVAGAQVALQVVLQGKVKELDAYAL
jgi:hypothetical protein